MIENKKDNFNQDDFNTICEECSKEEETVIQNLILFGFKLCESCKLSKTLFPM